MIITLEGGVEDEAKKGGRGEDGMGWMESFDVFSLDLPSAERQILRYSGDEKPLC